MKKVACIFFLSLFCAYGIRAQQELGMAVRDTVFQLKSEVYRQIEPPSPAAPKHRLTLPNIPNATPYYLTIYGLCHYRLVRYDSSWMQKAESLENFYRTFYVEPALNPKLFGILRLEALSPWGIIGSPSKMVEGALNPGLLPPRREDYPSLP